MANGTALLVVDVQVAMFDGEPLPFRHEEVLENIRAVIGKARAARTPVIFVQHDHATYEPMKRDMPGWQIHPAVAPLPGERIVNKKASDSFYGTPLRSELDALGVTDLVVTGMQTELCVDTTCRRAISLDFDVTLVSDGHTTWDGGELTAAQVIAQTNAALANLAHPTHGIVAKPASEIAF
jgi:nicotinamidase-related amidase